MESSRLKGIWKAKIPLEVRIFLWMIYHDRIPSAEQLARRNWQGDLGCKLCGEIETSEHIMFRCPLARFVWGVLRDTLRWGRRIPSNIQDFWDIILERLGKQE